MTDTSAAPPGDLPADLATAQTELEAAEADLAEARSLGERLASLRQAKAAAEQRLAAARAKLDGERRDVAALESFSPTRIWAALRGTQVDDLTREQAEVQAAEYDVAVAESEAQRLTNDEAVLAGRAAALGDAAERRTRALAAKERALTGAGGRLGEELTGIAADLGRTEAELKEVGEAFDAATLAGQALERADGMLRQAGSWAGFDTFLGGGMLSDMAKYDRMDKADRLLRHANAALARLGTELADLGRAGVPGPQVDDLTRTFDVWFDNIFSDWSVMRRIEQARDRTGRALQDLAVVHRSLRERRDDLVARVGELRARREELLGG